MKYRFEYPNGIIQDKVLISHDDYLKVKVLPEDSGKEEKRKGKLLKELTGGMEWFTDRSPMFEAITTGIIKANGEYPVKIINYE